MVIGGWLADGVAVVFGRTHHVGWQVGPRGECGGACRNSGPEVADGVWVVAGMGEWGCCGPGGCGVGGRGGGVGVEVLARDVGEHGAVHMG